MKTNFTYWATRHIQWALFAASSFVICVRLGTAQTLNDGLVARYEFAGNANDSTGNGHQGAVNGASLTADRFGVPNQCYSFDGVNDYVHVPDLLTSSHPFTWSAWFRLAQPSQQSVILSQGLPPLQISPSLSINDPLGSLTFYTYTFQPYYTRTPFRNWGTTRWHHATVTGSAGGVVSLFVDGRLVAQTSNQPFGQQNSNFYIGANIGQGGLNYFEGAIDDVRVYNRELSAAEVAALHELESTVQISVQPQTQSVVQRQPLTLSVTATGNGALSYQWQRNGDNIPGATDAMLDLGLAKPWHVGIYQVTITDGVGSLTSDAATITLDTNLPTQAWDNLLLFLPFAGDMIDRSTSARAVTQTDIQIGLAPDDTPSGSAYFDGINSRLDFSPNLPDLTDMTISFWVQSENETGRRTLFADWDDATSNDVGIEMTDRTLSVFANKNGTAVSWTSDEVFLAGKWNHVVWVMTPTESKVFLNGLLEATISQPANNVGYKLRSNIGYFNYAGGKDFFKGSISAFRIYGRAISDNEARYLYAFDAPEPEIRVSVMGEEIMSGDPAPDPSSGRHFGVIRGEDGEATRQILIENLGPGRFIIYGDALTGPNVAGFSSNAITPLEVAAESDLTIELKLDGATSISGDLNAKETKGGSYIMSCSDADESMFEFAIAATVISSKFDTDTDGLDDWSEYKLGTFGFDRAVSQPALVTQLFSNVGFARPNLNAAGFFTTSQVQGLHIATPLLEKNQSTGTFRITFGLKKSTTLIPGSFVRFPLLAPQTSINGNGELEFEFTTPDDAAFFQLNAR